MTSDRVYQVPIVVLGGQIGPKFNGESIKIHSKALQSIFLPLGSLELSLTLIGWISREPDDH